MRLIPTAIFLLIVLLFLFLTNPKPVKEYNKRSFDTVCNGIRSANPIDVDQVALEQFSKKQEMFLSGLSKRYEYNWKGQAVKIGQWDTISIIIDSVLELYQQYGRLNYVVRKSDTPKFNLDQTDTIVWYMPGKGQRGAKWDTDIVFHANRWKWATQQKLSPYFIPPAKINCTSPFEDSEGIKKSLTWTLRQSDTSLPRAFHVYLWPDSATKDSMIRQIALRLYRLENDHQFHSPQYLQSIFDSIYRIDTVTKIMCSASGVKQIEFTAPSGYEVFSTNDNKYHQRITIYRNSNSVDSSFYLMIRKMK